MNDHMDTTHSGTGKDADDSPRPAGGERHTSPGITDDLYRLLLEESLDPIFCFEPDGTYRYVNRAFAAPFKKTPAEIIGKRIWDIFSPDEAEKRFTVVKDVFARGVTRVIEVRVPTPAADLFFITTAHPVKDDHGTVLSVICSSKEITERKKMEQALRKSEELYRLISENVIDVIWMIDVATQKFTYVSPSVVKLRGYTAEEVMGQDMRSVLTDESYAFIMEMLPKRLADYAAGNNAAMVNTSEVDQPCKDGSIVHTEVTTTFLADEQRRVHTVLGITRDIGERRQAEQKRLELERRLLHAQKLESLGILAGGIAHDFNNLLLAMLGNLELAANRLPSGSPVHENIERARRAADRAADLTRQMLAYSGRGQFVVKNIDVNELVRENVHLFNAAIAKNAVLRLFLADHLPLIAADVAQIQQVMMNLLTNASDAIGEAAGVISLSTGCMQCDAEYLASSRLEQHPPAGAYLWIEIADTGCGMDAEAQARMFDPFFTTKFTGRGLGMSAVLGIMRGHKGAIRVDSTPGRGTTIRVLFPVPEQAAASVPAEAAKPAAAHAPVRRTILVVDDEEFVREMCCDMIETFGFDTLEANSGSEAVEKVKAFSGPIACALIDLSMPELDGMATIQKLHALRPDMKAILSSGYSEQEITRKYGTQALAGFLQKPYRSGTLRDMLEQVIAAPPPKAG